MALKNVIVGLGITGRALLDHFVARREPCIAFEGLSQENFKKVQATYPPDLVESFFGELPTRILDEAGCFFVSPGVPLNQPWAQEAVKKKIPITGELEFASRKIAQPLIAVTGTNGKSTTVSLIQRIFEAAGYASSLKGNIGTPLITAVDEPPKDFYVVEVSSFQLETVEAFRPKVAVMMNVTDDHLERYRGLDDYAAAKAKITANQGVGDFFIYNADDVYASRMVSRAKRLPFSLVNHFEEGGFVDRDAMVIRWEGRETRYPLEEASLTGLHNQENMLAAILAATVLGSPEKAIRQALASFKALPHRLQKLGIFKGVAFYDDSKATNVGSTVMSLASFEKNVVLILGGRDKGGDYAPLKPLIKAKVRGLILFGEAKDLIGRALSDFPARVTVETMEEAVKEAYRMAKPGDTVLLAPACSSFDLYRNYAERGDDFKKWVEAYADAPL